MHLDELTALISKTSVLMEQFERNCQSLSHHQQMVSEALQQSAQRLPSVVSQSADESLRTLPNAILERVGTDLERPVQAYEKRLTDASTKLQREADTLASQIKRLESLHRHLVWKVVGAAVGSVLIVLVGGGWLAWQYRAEIEENRISADLLRAYNQADVTLCGEQLCANVDPKGPAYGDKKKYRPVLPR